MCHPTPLSLVAGTEKGRHGYNTTMSGNTGRANLLSTIIVLIYWTKILVHSMWPRSISLSLCIFLLKFILNYTQIEILKHTC